MNGEADAGKPSVFGYLDQEEVISRIDAGGDDDLSSCFFGDCLTWESATGRNPEHSRRHQDLSVPHRLRFPQLSPRFQRRRGPTRGSPSTRTRQRGEPSSSVARQPSGAIRAGERQTFKITYLELVAKTEDQKRLHASRHHGHNPTRFSLKQSPSQFQTRNATRTRATRELRDHAPGTRATR
jgi:hypothetical protein